jgi:hypothetical protein
MSANPYSSPNSGTAKSAVTSQSIVRAPAVALIVVSIICIVFVAIAFLFSGFLLVSGTAGRMQQPSIGVSKETQIAIRMVWSVFILVANTVILVAAIKMRSLRNFPLSNLGAILAVIPCIGPCYLLGIPFGIWALIALHKPGVKEDFR